MGAHGVDPHYIWAVADEGGIWGVQKLKRLTWPTPPASPNPAYNLPLIPAYQMGQAIAPDRRTPR